MKKTTVLKIDLFQPTANYKMALTSKVKLTYPLPPYSTVSGFLYRFIGKYVPIEISIQGKYDDIEADYSTHLFYKDDVKKLKYLFCPFYFQGELLLIPEEAKRNKIEGCITRMPIYVQLLHNVRTIIHVKAEEKIINSILSGFTKSDCVFYLGRREDIARIEEIKEVEVRENEDYIDTLKYDAYIPFDILERSSTVKPNAVPFMLNGKYELKTIYNSNKIRVFQKIHTAYVTKDQSVLFEPGQILVDSDGDCLFLQKI